MRILAHSVPMLGSGLSPMQEKLLESEKFVRLVSAPTGSGKSYAFVKSAVKSGKRILFVVPTKRLLQNLINDARDQARYQLRQDGWSEDRIESWVQKRIIEWSGNQTPEDGRSLTVTRIRQVEDSKIKIIFAIPEVVVRMISGLRVTGGTRVTPFMYVRRFDHIVFDEFHTIDDRSFGLSCLLSLLACSEREGKVSLLSATPVDIISVLEGVGISESDIDIISEEIVSGHPEENRPIHGDVVIDIHDHSTLLETLERNIDFVRGSVLNGYTVIVIYDSLERLKKQEKQLRELLQESGILGKKILTVSSIDDSERKPGRSCIGHVYRDPREYSVLICTSSVELGVSFTSNLMLMEPGFNTSSFIQRIGRVSRGEYSGKVVVSCPQSRYSRHRWIRRVKAVVDQNEVLEIEDFTKRVLNDVRQQLEPDNSNSEDPSVEFYRKVSWRGLFWAGLFIEAIISTKMNVQKEARERLKKLRGKKVKLISAKIGQITRIDIVNDNLPSKAQPHKEWVNALYMSALTYRDIGSTIKIIDPDGTEHTARESFIRRTTNILTRYIIQHDEDGENIIKLRSKTLDQEIQAHSGDTMEDRLRLHIRSPIGDRGFSVLIHERDRKSESLSTLLVQKWSEIFSRLISRSGKSSNSPQEKVMLAATELVKLLGRPPLEEDYEDSGESAIFA